MVRVQWSMGWLVIPGWNVGCGAKLASVGFIGNTGGDYHRVQPVPSGGMQISLPGETCPVGAVAGGRHTSTRKTTAHRQNIIPQTSLRRSPILLNCFAQYDVSCMTWNLGFFSPCGDLQDPTLSLLATRSFTTATGAIASSTLRRASKCGLCLNHHRQQQGSISLPLSNKPSPPPFVFSPATLCIVNYIHKLKY